VRRCARSVTPPQLLVASCGTVGAAKQLLTAVRHDCAKADWADHKLVCEVLRTSCEEELAAFVALGRGSKQTFNQNSRNIFDSFAEIPGLRNEIELLAWKHRAESPIIDVHTSESSNSDVAGSTTQVRMIPRSVWDEGSHYIAASRDCTPIQLCFDSSSFCSNKQYVVAFTVQQHTKYAGSIFKEDIVTLTRGVAIVQALTAATRAEDLADAFAWIEKSMQQSHKILPEIRSRSTSVHGSSITGDSVPVSTRAINNKVAYCIMERYHLEFDIRLIGLCGAAHLNGRKGVILGKDPSNHERWNACLCDGICFSVRAGNFVHIRRENYKRTSA